MQYKSFTIPDLPADYTSQLQAVRYKDNKCASYDLEKHYLLHQQSVVDSYWKGPYVGDRLPFLYSIGLKCEKELFDKYQQVIYRFYEEVLKIPDELKQYKLEDEEIQKYVQQSQERA